MMEIAEVEEIFAYAKDNNWLSSIFYISIKQWPEAPFEPIDHYVDFLFGDNLYASEKLSEMTIDILFKKMEVFIFTGLAVDIFNEECETKWWEVSIYADGVDQRVFEHFNEWNNFGTKKEVLDALYCFDKEITKTK